MSYPVRLVHPERPSAVFSHIGGAQYLTPTGETASFSTVLQYVQTSTSAPSRQDVMTVQTALNNLPSAQPRLVVDGLLGANTSGRLVEFQMSNGLLPTGIIDAPTRARLLAPAPSPNPSQTPNPNPTGDPYAEERKKKNVEQMLFYGGIALLIVALFPRN